MTTPVRHVVQVDGLCKSFEVPVREAGMRASLRALIRREHRTVQAVDDISFHVDAGEVVGFLGPNGAGKTTTLKMLSGLLHPTRGGARVLGFEPQHRQADYLRQMALIMGNRNQLQWDLPALDSFELHRAVYRIPRAEFLAARDELVDLLDLGGLVTKPVRNLSLGERMKMEFADSLLHSPQVLFLDEPTIGLDVTMQKRIRGFINDYNRRHGATVMLTSHYMADVTALCKRVVLIHHGRILFDGDLSTLSEQVDTHKTLGVRLGDGSTAGELARFGDVVDAGDGLLQLRVERATAPRVAAELLRALDVVDVTIEDPPLEDVIESFFAASPS